MSFDAITEILALPRLPRVKEGEDLAKRVNVLETFIADLVRILEEKYLQQLVTLANLQLQVMNVGVFYFQLPDADGNWADEDVRLIKVTNGDIELQEFDGSDWRSGVDATALWGF